MSQWLHEQCLLPDRLYSSHKTNVLVGQYSILSRIGGLSRDPKQGDSTRMYHQTSALSKSAMLPLKQKGLPRPAGIVPRVEYSGSCGSELNWIPMSPTKKAQDPGREHCT